MRPSPSMQHIIDNLPVVIFEYTIFPDGSRDFTYLSPGCESILGVSRELLLNGTHPLQSFIHHLSLQILRREKGVKENVNNNGFIRSIY